MSDLHGKQANDGGGGARDRACRLSRASERASKQCCAQSHPGRPAQAAGLAHLSSQRVASKSSSASILKDTRRAMTTAAAS